MIDLSCTRCKAPLDVPGAILLIPIRQRVSYNECYHFCGACYYVLKTGLQTVQLFSLAHSAKLISPPTPTDGHVVEEYLDIIEGRRLLTI